MWIAIVAVTSYILMSCATAFLCMYDDISNVRCREEYVRENPFEYFVCGCSWPIIIPFKFIARFHNLLMNLAYKLGSEKRKENNPEKLKNEITVMVIDQELGDLKQIRDMIDNKINTTRTVCTNDVFHALETRIDELERKKKEILNVSNNVRTNQRTRKGGRRE